MVKKLVISVVLSLVFLGGVLYSTLFFKPSNSGGQYTVLAIKEENVRNYNSMPVLKNISSSVKVDVNWEHATSKEYSNSKASRLSSKTTDAVYHADLSNKDLYNYGRRGKLLAIDQYLDYMPNFKRILRARPDIKEALLSPDKHIYSLPKVEEMGLVQYPNILFINKKWVAKLIDDGKVDFVTKDDLHDGLKLKRSEFKEILKGFRDGDMNGNNDSSDEIPLSFVRGNWQGNESDLIASFGVPENTDHKTIINGKIEFTIENENWFKAIQELHDWYSENLIDISAMDTTKGQNSFLANGKDTTQHVARYGAFYWWEMETVVSPNRYDEYIVMQPLVDDATNKQYVGVSNKPEVVKGECVILNNNDKDKTNLLKYFDKFFEPYNSAQLNYGSIGIAFENYTKDNKLITKPLEEGQNADDRREKNAPYGVLYLTAKEWEKYVEMEDRAVLRLDRLEKYVKPYTYSVDKVDNKGNVEQVYVLPIPNLNYKKAELNELLTYESNLGGNISQKMVMWITGDNRPTEGEWRSFLNTNKTAISKIKGINQAAYDRYAKKYLNNKK